MSATRSGHSRRALVGLVVGLMFGSAVFGGGAAWAYWTASVTAATKVRAATIAITHTNLPSLDTTYLNTITTLTKTGSFTVKNTGDLGGTLSINLASTGTLAPKILATAWPVAAASSCTASAEVGANSTAGTWASLSVWSPGTLAPGESQAYCVRTRLNNGASVGDAMTAADASGTLSSVGTLTASLTAGSWSATATAPTSTQKTSAIFPLASGYRPEGLSDIFWLGSSPAAGSGTCLDVAGGGASNGNAVAFFTCTTNDNQTFQILPVAGSAPAAVTLRPLHAMGSNVTALAAGTMALAAPSAADPQQQWIVQDRSNGASQKSYQLVNVATGQCMPASGASLVDCTSASSVIYLHRRPVTLTPVSLSILRSTFAIPMRNYYRTLKFQYQKGGTWTDWGTASPNTTSSSLVSVNVTFSVTNMDYHTSYPVRLLVVDGTNSYTAWTGTALTGGALVPQPKLTAGGG